MTLDAWLTVAAILGFAASVQTAAGFGIGLVAAPLLLAANYTLPQVVPMIVGAALGQAVTGVWALRAHVDWRLAGRVALGQWVGIPLGVAAMLTIAGSPQLPKQIAGVGVVVLVTARLLLKPRPKARIAAGWAPAAGALGGFLGGFVAMGGPPLVFFALHHDWPANRFRTFLWTQFLCGAPVLVAALAWRLGAAPLRDFAIGVSALPVVWLGMAAGAGMGRRWSRRTVDAVAMALLYAIAASALLPPLLR